MGGFMKLGIDGTNQKGMHYQANDGKWRHLAVSLSPVGESSVSVEMFMDGNQETKFLSAINTNDIELNTQPSDLVAGSNGYLGWLDDLRIYSTKLNEGEIKMILEEKKQDDLSITNESYSSLRGSNPTTYLEVINLTLPMGDFLEGLGW